MKVIAFNGSPKPRGNTSVMIDRVFALLKTKGIDTEVVHLGGGKIKPCTACYECFKMRNQKCVIDDDILNDCVKKAVAAEGIILASPTYFANVSGEMKAFIDRMGSVSMANGYLFKHKVGAALAAAYKTGALNAFNALNDFLLINQFFIPGSKYWNVGNGMNPGDVADDAQAMDNLNTLAHNMATLMEKVF